MAKIDNVRTDLYRLPTPTAYSDSTHGVMVDFELLTVRIRDADGAEGLGYTYTVHAGAAAIQVMIDRYLAGRLAGQDADDIERLWQDMWWHLHYAGRGGHLTSAISAVDIALWDLKARRAGLPLWRYFGGYDPQVPVYAGGIDLDFPIEELLAQADRFQEQGFRAIKMKVGRPSLREDLERVRRMREHLGDDFPLMVDANMKWSADQAVAAGRALREFGLVWVEEPTIPDDVAGHLRVVREGGVPVATGENLHTLYEFQTFITAGAVTYPEPDVSNCGGMTVFRKICALAEAHNLPVTSHGVHDLTVHPLASAPNRTYMEAHGFALDRFLAEPLKIVNGCAIAPERPGHGVELDWDRLESCRA
ncbi:mandelate racemase/muconate lactonizing enzyme family protein [Thermoactinospora rubra]|uniref:mandelate racemase/muconate lactonizing enzyme family protein n=1 Tax=Thermoactinospora rubra TaxID=1088767 RepID=UPI000A0FA6BC|nr:mandelate racemase/muconate lactonizing enzyme family protein [Thermoactinospora rubra]